MASRLGLGQAWVYPTAAAIGNVTFRVFGCLEVRGQENVPPRGPVILAANHLSNADPPLLAVVTPRPLSFVAKRGLFASPFSRWLFTSLRAYPVDRDRRDVAAMVWALNLLRRDEVVLVFPEGTRSRTRGLQRGQPGVAYLALKSQATIVPVAITGTERVPALWRLLFPFTRITATFGQPFTLPGIEGQVSRPVLESLTDTMMRRIAALLPPEYQGSYAVQSPAQQGRPSS